VKKKMLYEAGIRQPILCYLDLTKLILAVKDGKAKTGN
jgi:hypothetical protein